MKKKPAKKPTLDRLYRQNLEFKRMLLNQMALIRLDIASERKADRDVLKTLADHCARLLREKETLMKSRAGTITNPGAEVNAWCVEFPQKVPPPADEANRFIAKPTDNVTVRLNNWTNRYKCGCVESGKNGRPPSKCGAHGEAIASWSATT